MDWKNEAITKLRRYDIMRQALRNIPEEIARLKEDATLLRTASTDSIFVRTTAGRGEDVRLNNIVKRQELERTLRYVRQWLDVADRGLFALSDEDRMILQKLYLYPQKDALQRLSLELGLELLHGYGLLIFLICAHKILLYIIFLFNKTFYV